MLKEDNRKLQGEQILLQESCEEARRLCEEAQGKICDLWTKQQQEHQRLEENLQSLRKQKELLTQQRDLAVKLQHHFTVSQMRFENLQQELEQTTAQDESLLQMELLKQKHYVPGNTC
ncbi:disks large homolog 5-like isoform X2 [Peromyscus eremicus]|uniref:disks large homolog 5-like isoform X2 n=1 Tax=Peromyscus eremicus TaxID=42410 RepID=UPI0027DBA94B|nr:disks large homolog 5-like isoform X2 [Peromyscus eremicus]